MTTWSVLHLLCLSFTWYLRPIAVELILRVACTLAKLSQCVITWSWSADLLDVRWPKNPAREKSTRVFRSKLNSVNISQIYAYLRLRMLLMVYNMMCSVCRVCAKCINSNANLVDVRALSSNGRTPATHGGGRGIDTVTRRVLYIILTLYLRVNKNIIITNNIRLYLSFPTIMPLHLPWSWRYPLTG